MDILRNYYNRLFQTGPLYAASSVWVSIANILSGILIIRWVAPTELGLWQSISVIQLYTPIFDFGVTNGLNRELPFLYGKKKIDLAHSYVRSALGYSLSTLVITAILFLIGILYYLKIGKNSEFIYGLLGVGVISIVNIYSRYLTVTFRSSQSFRKLSLIQLISGATSFLSLPIVYYFGFYGLIIAQVMSISVTSFLMHVNRPIKSSPLLNWSFKELIKTGFPVFLMGYLRGITGSFNRVILLIFSNITMVGYFAPVSAISTLNMLPKILGNYFFPKMNLIYGESDDPKKLWPIVVRINKLLFFCGLFLSASVIIMMPFIMPLLFPEYIDSTRAIQIMSLTFIFSGTLVSHNVLYAVKDYKLASLFSIMEAIMLFVIPYLFAKFIRINILESIALGVVSVQLILFLVNILLIRISLFKK